MVTPRVELYGRQHFGVADDIAIFPGVELENNGGVGTVGSHWERRVMGTEMMTGTVKVCVGPHPTWTLLHVKRRTDVATFPASSAVFARSRALLGFMFDDDRRITCLV